jgi:FtsP/CotA-like multicopper oxidase with cupredoxin domain
MLAASSGIGLAARGSRSHCATHFPKLINDGFPQPPMLFSRNGVLNVTLRAAPSTMRLNGQTVNTMAYNGTIPGPTLVACPGDHVIVHLDNGLSLPTNLHVHGLHVSPQGDGDNVFVRIDPNKSHTYSYEIPLDQQSGAFWYHPHWHPDVFQELSQGLAGAIVIEGGLDNLMSNIPQRLIMIQGDKPGGQGLPPGQGCHLPGFGLPQPPGCPPSGPGPQLIPTSQLYGPGPILVNGVVNPTLKIAPGQVQRWRIFNATGGSFLDLNLDNQNLYVLAQDGQTLHWTRPTKDLLIGPGSRREVLVRGGAPGRYAFSTLPFKVCSRSCQDPIGGIPNNGTVAPKTTVLTVVSSGRRVNDRMPSSSLGGNGLPDLRKAHVDVRRTIVFARMPNPFGLPTFPLNGMLFDPNRVDITMQLNSVEQWTLENPTTSVDEEWHNFHIHQNPFQVVSINGVPVNFIDYQDTVNLPPGAKVVIRMRPIDFTGKFVFHCHLTFHEDQGMMGVVQVVRHLTAAQSLASVDYIDGMIAISSSAYGSSQAPPAPSLRTLYLLCHLGSLQLQGDSDWLNSLAPSSVTRL